MASSSSRKPFNDKIMSRPGHGRAGKPIHIQANFFKLAVPSRLRASQYAVQLFREKREKGRTVVADVSSTELISFNRNCFKALMRRYGDDFGCRIAYNGRSIAYAPTEINRRSLGVRLRLSVDGDGNACSSSQPRAERVEFTLSHAKYLPYDDLLRGKVSTTDAAEFIACLDVVLAEVAATHHVQVGRSFYSEDRATPLGRRNVTSSAWTGFYQSARLSEKGLLVNMDESFTGFWNRGGQPLTKLIMDANDGQELQCRDSRALRFVTSKLRGLKVKAVHTGIVYRVHGFSDRGADRITFDSDGRRISISQYFSDQYNIRLKYGNAPCVKTNPKKDTYLPLEVLAVVPNQRVMGVLSPDEIQTMVRTASTKPHIRRENASRKVEKLKYRHNPTCSDFGLSVDPTLVSINARVLPPPTIRYQRGTVDPSNGQWRAKQGANNPVEIYSWAICSTARLREDEVKTFAKDLMAAFDRSKIRLHMKYPSLYSVEEHRLERKMGDIATEFSRNNNLKMRSPRLQLLIIIRERQETAGYNMIKRVGDLQLGIVTQVCLAKHCGSRGRGRDMYCDNLVLKINAKLGGQNGLVLPYRESTIRSVPDVDFLDVPHVILGADVTHPMPGGKGPSIAALVCSRDRQGLQFSAALRSQTGRKEMISDIGQMFKEVYRVWYDNFQGKVHARKIIMFRDGVSEGQFQEVMQEEVAGIRRACVDIGKDMRPRITYIIVTKRHHTRFFPTSREQADRSGNVPPGTVVDTGITSDEYYDFYINSHAGIQGTNKPSKYTVLIDENKIPPDALQAYIYRLTHSFVRCNRPVSMVHSAYYAHLLAFRGRAYLGDDGSDSASQASQGSSVPPVPRIHPIHRGRLFFC